VLVDLVGVIDIPVLPVGLGYDGDSNLTTTAYPDAAQVDTTVVDDAGRPSSITMAAGATTLASLDYTRDDLGQLTGEDQTSLPGTDATWGYNSLEQLTDQNSTPTWSYDPGDNLTATSGAVDQVFNDANQLCSTAPVTGGTCAVPASGATTYSYDDRGNRTSMTPPSPAAATSYSYDQANRLTGIDTASASYGYDADGLRRSKTVGLDTTEFTWDRSGSLPQLLTETTGTDTTSYLYGPSGVAYAQIDPDGSVTYLHHDQIGSVRLLTDDTGSVTGAATYDPYGSISASSGTLSHLGYTGQYTDTESGFVYLRARYYDPTTGQFLDPLVSASLERYAYVAGGPLNNTDLTGLWCPLTSNSDGSCRGSGVADFAAETATLVANTISGTNVAGSAIGMITSGGNCYVRDVRLECDGAYGSGNRAWALGNVIMSPEGELSNDRFEHEKRHGYQWAALTPPGFISVWVVDSAQAWVRGKISGEDCDAERFMVLEWLAGLDDGGYTRGS